MSPRKTSAPPPEEPAPLAPAVTRVIDLGPADRFRATWRDLPPLERPKPAPFDLDDCVKRLSRVTARTYDWNWDKAELAENFTPEEARFWYAAMSGAGKSAKPRQLALHLGRQSFERSPDLGEIKRKVASGSRYFPDTFLIPLSCFLSPEEMVEVLRGPEIYDPEGKKFGDFQRSFNTLTPLYEGFRRYVRPYLKPEEVQRLRAALNPKPSTSEWLDSTHYGPIMPTDVWLAGALGDHPLMEQLVTSFPDNIARSTYRSSFSRVHDIVFGLGGADLVKLHLRRLGLGLRDPQDVRAWLAHTEFAGLDFVKEQVRAKSYKPAVENFLKAFCLARAPEIAPHLLELKVEGKAPGLVREWFTANPGNAVAGLIPVAAGRGKLADEARAVLVAACRDGHSAFLEEQLSQADPEVAGRVRRAVLEREEREVAVHDDTTTPRWLAEGVAEVVADRPRLPEWARPVHMPPVLVEGRALTEEQAGALLYALSKSTLENPHVLVQGMKAKGDPASLDTFAWKLFEMWSNEGSPSPQKWAFLSTGQLGGDSIALKLTPLIRKWPQERQHKRAVAGLECLRAIGSDTALMQLNSIAQKQAKALGLRAQECMVAIATERGLSMGQLEDRIVPDLGLDARGGRVFDLGPRQFDFVLGPGLKPQVRDGAGKVKANLPKPGIKDDAEKGEAAVREWNLLKAQIREAVKGQSHRLEQAMVHGRRWQPEEFEKYLVRHPFLIHLTRLLLWGGYDKKGKVVRTFRVTEEQEYADVEDNPCTLEKVPLVGIVHPVQLTEDERSAWGQVFGDYELIAPFPQLGRRFHTLQPNEGTLTELTRFAGTKTEGIIASGILKRHGWTGGGYYGSGLDHTKPFPNANVTAGIDLGDGYETAEVKKVYFMPGVPGDKYKPTERVALGEIDPVVLSEVLGTAAVIASKGS